MSQETPYCLVTMRNAICGAVAQVVASEHGLPDQSKDQSTHFRFKGEDIHKYPYRGSRVFDFDVLISIKQDKPEEGGKN